MSETPKELFVAANKVVPWTLNGKIYTCPHCDSRVVTQYEGEIDPVAVDCHGFRNGHTLK